MSSGHRKCAFSLVEVLVVLAIVAVLTAVLLPVLSSVRAGARSSVCQSNLRQLGQSIQMYAQDFERYPRGLDPTDKYTPEIWSGHPATQGDVLAATPLLPTVIAPYTGNLSIWHCPSDSGFDIVDVTGRPLDARPSCYEKYGMSYLYRSEITLLNLAQEHLPRPSETNVLADADGLWHGTTSWFRVKGRYNVLFGDGHVKNIDRDTYFRTWDTPIR